jgi:hypothetical protein
VHVASSRRSCDDQVEDGRVDVMGYIRLGYPCFTSAMIKLKMDVSI